MLKRLAPLLVATALLAGGCATETIPDAEKILIESSSSPLGPGTVDGKVEKRAKTKKKRARLLTAEKAGVRFRSPVGWTALSEKDLSFAVDSPQGVELARLTGLTIDQLRARFETIDVYLIGFSGVLTVGVLGTDGALPSRAGFDAGFGDLDHTVESVDQVNTPLGAGRVFGYTISAGGGEQRGVSLYVLNGSTVVEITSAGTDAGQARAILDKVIRSLKRA